MPLAHLDQKSEEELLKTSVGELGLIVGESDIADAAGQLYKELEASGIDFKPVVYFSDDWGCPDGVPAIGIPFYLAHRILRAVETKKRGWIESPAEITQLLRHEAGHAFCYAHKLHELAHWKEIFGVYGTPYEDNFAAVVGSGHFVHHLEGWYAQKHSDDDFAETFAVLITPGFDWRRIYRRTKAFKKLAYASQLVREYGRRSPKVSEGALDVPVDSIHETLSEWYRTTLALSARDRERVLLLFYQEYPRQRPVHDEVVDQIKEVLVGMGYGVVLLPINRSIERITNGIRQAKPDVVFNLCETFRNNDRFDFNVTALLELLRIPFTGSGSGGLFLSNDKRLTKEIFDFHGISYPAYFVLPAGKEIVLPEGLAFPRFVKPVHQDASIGVDERSVVRDADALREKASQIHREIKDDALVEEYIEGREFFISIVGNEMLRPLELVELDFSNWPPDKPKIYTHRAKIEKESPEYNAVSLKVGSGVTATVPPEIIRKMYDYAVRAYRAFGVRDYARIDLRLSPEGKIYVLEANLNSYLSRDSETVLAAEASGLSYRDLIGLIISETLQRSKVRA